MRLIIVVSALTQRLGLGFGLKCALPFGARDYICRSTRWFHFFKTMLIYTRSISFAQFCKFRVLCDHWGGKQGLLIYLLVVLVVEWGLFPFHGKNGNTKTPLKIPDSCAQAVHSFFFHFCWWISFFVRQRLAMPRISKHWNHFSNGNAFFLLSSIFTNDLAIAWYK